jgi:hypothetical protein
MPLSRLSLIPNGYGAGIMIRHLQEIFHLFFAVGVILGKDEWKRFKKGA